MRVISVLIGALCFFAGAAQVYGADPLISDGRDALSLAELQAELLAVPLDVRTSILADKFAMERFAGGVLQDRRVAAAATEAGIPQLPEIKAKINKRSRDVLVDRYLTDEAERASGKTPDFHTLVREQFEANRSAYIRPEAIRVAHILIKVDVEDERVSEAEQRAKTEAVLARIKAGENFGKLASQVSEDQVSARRNGEIAGWVERGKMVPPFDKAAFALKPGEVSGIVRTRFGFHIIKQLEYRKAMRMDFSEVEAQLVAKARSDYQTERRNEVVKRFAGTQAVKVDDKVLETLRAK